MNHESKVSAIESFKTDPIPKIVIKNSIPALIAMMMVMVYNLADTFFLGLTHNDLAVTAVSFATPLFMIFMSLGTLFGVGGTSVISRALGEGKTEYAKKACSFCMWACVAVGGIMMAVLWIFLDDVTVMLGASSDSMKLTKEYLAIVIGCGIFSMISNCFSSVVRTEGQAMKAMTGTLIGNLLNLILDPIFILGFKWGVTGAAVATVIGNATAAGYYILYFLKGKSALSISPKYFSMKDGILSGVLSVGISASLANLLVSVSSIVVNSQLAGYEGGDMLVAGYGVTAKIIMIVTLIGIGIGSGVQPFLGYCYGAKEKERLVGGIRFSALFGLVFCAVISALCYIFAEPIVKVFLTDMTALESGVHFTRILMSTAWLIGAFAICQNTLQAIGAATPALLASIFRQGIIFIPAVFIMKAIIGVDGLIWAQPVADVLSLGIVILMLWRKIGKTDFPQRRQLPITSKEKHTKRKTIRRIILIVLVAVLVLSAVIVGMCLFNERPAVQTVATYQSTYCDTVINIVNDGGVEILPQSGDADTGLIFYVGAQIKPNAYIPLLARIAEQGYACFVPNLSFNMAALEPKAADNIISSHPEIKSWILAGHSMGGLTASGYADDHRDTVDGLILVAAYTNRDMSDAELPVLAVFGDTDGVMNKNLYEKRKAWNSTDFEEHIISGANHAQYGDYGKQPRDNDATISAEEQQTETAEIILDWLNRHNADGETNE